MSFFFQYGFKNFFINAEVSIKWPNDVLIDEKKVSGILIETADNDMVVIGIGVNTVSQPDDNQVVYPTTNLKVLGNVDNSKFLERYLVNFGKNYTMCQSSFAIIREN